LWVIESPGGGLRRTSVQIFALVQFYSYYRKLHFYFQAASGETMNIKSLGFVIAASLALTGPTWAHHSHAMYTDGDVLIDMEGTVSEVHWVNPHVWVYLDVINQQGQTSTWALEGANISALVRGGWAEDSIKAGDEITVRCRALKDGTDGCLLGFVTSINGIAMNREFD
jgi:hypothetical protein